MSFDVANGVTGAVNGIEPPKTPVSKKSTTTEEGAE